MRHLSDLGYTTMETQAKTIAPRTARLRQKIAMETSPAGKRKIKVKFARKATNEEIMHESMLVKGHVGLRIAPQIYGADGNAYGYKGVSYTIKVATVDDAFKIMKKLDDFMQKLAS
jgi:hypothetical protein